MKPLGTNSAVENGLTTPEKTSFQQVNKPLNQQTHRGRFATKNRFSIAPLYHHQRTKQPLGK